MPEPKEWYSVKHSPKVTTVTCTLQDDNLSVRWTVKGYISSIKASVAEAQAGARKAMKELQEAVATAEETGEGEAA